MSERSPHPSLAQMNALLEFLEANPDIAKGYSKNSCARERTRRQWERLAVTLNSLGGSEKDARQWNKYWCDKKSAVKKKAAARSAARRKTGGGVEEIAELNDMEERVVALLGGETFATGDSHLRIDPFAVPTPSSSGQQAVESDCSEVSRIPHLGSSHSEDIDFTINPEAMIPQEDDNDTMSIFSNNNHHQSSSLRDSGRQRSASILSTTTPTPPRTQQSNTTALTQTQTCPPTPTLPSPSILPPAQREVMSVTSPSVQSFSRRRTNSQVRRSRAPLSIHSSSRPSATNNRPPSQRRREFTITVDKFMQLEHQQMELQKQQMQLQQTILERLANLSERMVERDRILTQALRDGFDKLTDAMKRNE